MRQRYAELLDKEHWSREDGASEFLFLEQAALKATLACIVLLYLSTSLATQRRHGEQRVGLRFVGKYAMLLIFRIYQSYMFCVAALLIVPRVLN